MSAHTQAPEVTRPIAPAALPVQRAVEPAAFTPPAMPTTPATPPAVQRSVTSAPPALPTPAQPVRRLLAPTSTTTATSSPLPVARLTAPSTPFQATPAPSLPIAPARGGPGSGPGGSPTVQRDFRSATRSAADALSSATAATLGRLRPGGQSRQEQERIDNDPLPFPPDRNPAPQSSATAAVKQPESPRVPEGTFDPKDLTDFQIDELVHRMIGRITRLVRTELRMDRERIGRLRDDRR